VDAVHTFVVTDDGFHLTFGVDFTVPRTEGAVNVDNSKPCLHFYSAHFQSGLKVKNSGNDSSSRALLSGEALHHAPSRQVWNEPWFICSWL